MFAFFEQLAGLISSFVDFVISFFSNMITFFVIVGTSFTFLLEMVAYLPAMLQAAIISVISAAVIYLILGR